MDLLHDIQVLDEPSRPESYAPLGRTLAVFWLAIGLICGVLFG